MRILAMRPATPAGGKLIARFDIELPAGIRLFNLALKETQSGWRAFAPSAFGSAAATFTHELGAEIVVAAREALGEISHNDRSSY
jgi:creatinine amidohydrolase/Fe(II)-dependent formamide hydrolase-like protein